MAGVHLEREPLFTGIAGVSPASSNAFTLEAVESVNSGAVAFDESGRDARGPSSTGPSNSKSSALHAHAPVHYPACAA